MCIAHDKELSELCLEPYFVFCGMYVLMLYIVQNVVRRSLLLTPIYT